ncbi:MAG TPA: pilus assembly protein TadG-related protein [Mycobacteriales bacterium]|nr:pilus assembly protein TadG-related protein [Mycobacteriales bacterium]
MTRRNRRRVDDAGSITPLVIGYTAIAAVLIVVGIDASKVFLARRALAAAADSAALAAAQGVDRGTLYAGGVRCGMRLPLDGQRAGQLADGSVDDDRHDLRQTFASLATPRTEVRGGTVTVRLAGSVALPFGGVLGRLGIGDRDGSVGVTETAHADSPVAGAC